MTTRKDVPASRSSLNHIEYLTGLLGPQPAPPAEWLASALARVADALGATTAALCVDGLPQWLVDICDLTLSARQRQWVRDYGGEHFRSERTTVLLVDGKRSGGGDRGFTETGWRSALLVLFAIGERGRAGLIVGYTGSHLFSDADVAFARAAVNVLATALEREGADAQSIRRAKREWEATIDALPQVVCLLDPNGRVLRVNRAVERWGLGKIRGLPEQPGSCLLGPCCHEARCPSRATYRRFWEGPEPHREVSWEADCPALRRNIRITLRRLPDEAAPGATATDCAVMVIEDVTERRAVEATLRGYNQQLEAAVAERTERLAAVTERLQRELARHQTDKAALARSEAELRALSARLMEVQEAERKRFAAELHDGIGQSLTAIKYALESYIRAPAANGALPGLVLTKVREALEESRRLALDMRPAMLDDLGLIPTLEWFCREFQRLVGTMRVDAAFCVDEGAVPMRLRVPIFRITQEAMNNAAKHAKAHRIQVSLRERGGRLQLRVNDDGMGLPQPDAARVEGFGLRGMRERAEASDGRIAISRGARGGTLVEASWPSGHATMRRRWPSAAAAGDGPAVASGEAG